MFTIDRNLSILITQQPITQSLNNNIKTMLPHHIPILIALFQSTLAMGLTPVPTTSISPIVIELLDHFDLPINDLNLTATQQLSHNDFKTSNFTSPNCSISHLIYTSTYNPTHRTLTPPGQSLQHTVTLDALDLTISYQAITHPKLPTRKTFNCSTTLSIDLNYTKVQSCLGQKLMAQTGEVQFQGLAVFVDAGSMRVQCEGSMSEGERKIVQAGNGMNGTQGKSVLGLLREEEFTRELILGYFNENREQQQLSPTYQASYDYSYGGVNATFDMRTARVEVTDTGIAHSIRGTINNYNSIDNNQASSSQPSSSSSPQESAYHTLFSVDFIQNLLTYSVKSNQIWKNYKLDRSTFRETSFGFRLIDLQFMLEGAATKYKAYYLNNISLSCSPSKSDSLAIDQANDKLSLQMTWACKCNLLGLTPSPLLLDFDTRITYLLGVAVTNDKLAVSIQHTYLEGFEFRQVEDFKIIDLQLVKLTARRFIRDIVGSTVGSNFVLKNGSQKVALKENEGIWVG